MVAGQTWRIGGACDPLSGGRSIRSNCSRPWNNGTSARRSAASPRPSRRPLLTVGRVMNALGLGRLKNLETNPPVRRYQWDRPGDMIHVDTKQLPRFERVGHRITRPVTAVMAPHGVPATRRCTLG